MIYDLQKASVMKRFMAFLLDFILVIILITGFMCMFSAISGYDSYSNKLSSQMAEIEQKHGIPEITKEYEIDIDRYASLSEDERNSIPRLLEHPSRIALRKLIQILKSHRPIL